MRGCVPVCWVWGLLNVSSNGFSYYYDTLLLFSCHARLFSLKLVIVENPVILLHDDFESQKLSKNNLTIQSSKLAQFGALERQ